MLPAVPLVWSQARNVMPALTVPYQSVLGMNRTEVLASAASNCAAESESVPKSVHVEPPSVENCQIPYVVSAAVTAMPLAAPGSASLTSPESSVDTNVPLLDVSFSSICDRSLVPYKTGASL